MKKISNKEIQEIKEYVINCIVEGYNYSKEDAEKLLNKSTFLKNLQINTDYVLHYNLEYWAEKIVNNI